MLKHATALAGILFAFLASPVQSHDWAGAYAGGSLSYSTGTNRGFFTNSEFFGTSDDTPWGGDVNAARIGAFAGYNWYLSDTFVTGIEVSAAFGNVSGRSPGLAANHSTEITYAPSASLAVRFGYDAGRTLTFVSFGLTATEVSGAYQVVRFGQPVNFVEDPVYRLGTTLGVGADYRLTERGILRIGLSQTWFDNVAYDINVVQLSPTQFIILSPRTLIDLSVTELTVGYAFEF